MDAQEWVGGMTDFLLELRSEEIPARMQDKAREDLARLFSAELDKAGLKAAEIITYATPRRLALIAKGLPLETQVVSEETKGPKVGAPPQAMEGFLRKVGLAHDQLVERDGVFFAVVEKPGRKTADVLAEAIPAIIRTFPWPKSQRWGAASISTESLRWVRPLQGIVALLGDNVVDCEIDGIVSGSATKGHRFHHSGEVTIGNAGDYAMKLRAAHVIVDQDERRAIIRAGAEKAAADAGLVLVPDEGLVNENSGLTEWPVPMLGRFDPAFLEVPEEVIQLTARVNQKYFVCNSPLPHAGGVGGGPDGHQSHPGSPAASPPSRERAGKLANAFVCTANIVANDGGAAIVAGNEKVLAARLSDAKFFWEQDHKKTLEEHAKKLENIVFHEALGTLASRVSRIVAVASDRLPELVGWPEEKARTMRPLLKQAATVAKADLVTEMVGEFPELQGVMGGYYAAPYGGAVSDAIRDQYKPAGPSDDLPSGEVGTLLAIADKADALFGFFAYGMKPTGSKDPYALRRAALGIIRLIVENDLRLSLEKLFSAVDWERLYDSNGVGYSDPSVELVEFIIDRLKVQQREAGVRHDLIDVVFALGGEDDLVRLLARVKALQGFVGTEEGANLLAGYKRAANILKQAESSSPSTSDGEGDRAEGVVEGTAMSKAPPSVAGATATSPSQVDGEEQALLTALDSAEPKAAAAIEAEQFEDAMAALASLRAPIDAFFDGVMVNDPDPEKRAFRLGLLTRFRDAVHRVADFSRIEG